MRKPEIAEGEWDYKLERMLYTVDSDKSTIPIARTMTEENAKAISAVPEMIDALMEARHDLILWVKSFDGVGADTDDTKRVTDKIERALTKAGVEL